MCTLASILIANPAGSGSRLMVLTFRNASPSQKKYFERSPLTYRVGFGIGLLVIGAGWLWVGLVNM